MPHTSSTPIAELDPDFDDLNALLADSLESEREKVEAKAARERKKRGGLSQTERIEDEARIAAWEARHEWEDIANVGQFRRYDCACGQHHTVFEQLMVRQRHRYLRDSFRWQQQAASQMALPSETVLRLTEVPVCGSCMDSKGWDFTHSTEWRI